MGRGPLDPGADPREGRSRPLPPRDPGGKPPRLRRLTAPEGLRLGRAQSVPVAPGVVEAAPDDRAGRGLGGGAPIGTVPAPRPPPSQSAAPGPYRLPRESGRSSARSGPPRPALRSRPAAGRGRCSAADGPRFDPDQALAG